MNFAYKSMPSGPELPSLAGAPERRWLRRIGILNDYVRIPYANGSSFASQLLQRELAARGHEVTIVGPRDRQAMPEELPERHLALPAVPFRVHPGVQVPFPTRRELDRVAAERFDVVLGQTTTALLDLGVWLRAAHHVPFLAVNTVHLPSVYNVVLPDGLLQNRVIDGWFQHKLVPWLERQVADAYNRSDGLIVLSHGLREYWQERGVRVPIHVIPRAVEPKIFDRAAGADPFPDGAVPGGRLLVVCRHTREKGLARLLTLFARHVAPARPDATLTLVGDGPDHESFRRLAQRLGVADKTFFPGEFRLTDIPRFYRHGDVFVYPSLSETYGQVVSEAMWCGLPVVAFDDNMGVAHQLEQGASGILVKPGPDTEAADREFGEQVLRLLNNRGERFALSQVAQARTRARAHPGRVMERYYTAFEDARLHCAATLEERIGDRLAATRAVARWTSISAALAGFGCLRPPTVVNRHGRGQPGWSELEQAEQAPATLVDRGLQLGRSLRSVVAD